MGSTNDFMRATAGLYWLLNYGVGDGLFMVGVQTEGFSIVHL